MLNVQQFVCEQIANVPDRSPQFDRTVVWIRCPYHGGGQERTPSFKINLEGSRYPVGTGFCFACKRRTEWNDLAETLGIAKLKKSSLVHGVANFSFTADKTFLPDLSTLLDWPDQEWRTIHPETIKLYGGKLEFRNREVMLYLPVFIRRNYVGGIHAAMDITHEEKARGKKAYDNVIGPWSATSVFGFNQARRMTGPLTVVEGPRDTLRVAQLGGRVIGLLGAAVTDDKVKHIQAIDPPYVIILTDPDEAGDLAAEKLKEKLDAVYMPNVRIRLPEDRDPANLTPKSYTRVLDLASRKMKKHGKGRAKSKH